MHNPLRRATSLTAAALLAVLLTSAGLAASPTPAAADATGPSIALDPASGSDDTADAVTLDSSLPGCGSSDFAVVQLVGKAETASLSMTEATTIANGILGPQAAFKEGRWNATGSVAGDGSITWGLGAGFFMAQTSWADFGGGLLIYPSLGELIDDPSYGVGDYTLVLMCVSLASGSPAPTADPGNAGNALAAVLPITFNADHSWSTGAKAQADTTAVAFSATPAAGGGALLSATVTDSTTPANVPTGTVTFFEGATKLNSTPATVDATGKASFTATATQLPVGDHNITAQFTSSDDAKFADSASTATKVSVPPGASKTATQVSLTATATGTEVDLRATVQTADGATATGVTGTVDFAETSGTGWTKTGVAVSNGVAETSDTGLTPGSSYTFTASYKAAASENFADSVASAAQNATVPAAGQNGTLTDGGVVQPGATYEVTLPAGTFGDNDTVNVVLHSTPQNLASGTAGADGALGYQFTAPSDLVAGESHSLVFTDAADSSKTATITFTVAATDDPGTDDPGAAGDPAGTDPGSSNQPSTFLTDSTRWATSTPQGVISMLGGLILLSAAGIGTWLFLWRRRAISRSNKA